MSEPSHPEHHEWRTSLGVYALGQLSPEEARRVERHLAGCSSCRAEYAELVPVAGALASLRRAGPTGSTTAQPRAGVEPPAHLQSRVVEPAGIQGRGRHRIAALRPAAWTLAGAVAATAAFVVGDVVRDDAASTPRLPSAPVVPLEAVAVQPDLPGIDATADLVAHTWGVEVKLSATGFDAGSRYRVIVLGRDGRGYSAGGFVGTGQRELNCNLNTSIPRDRATGFEVRDSSGRLVAEAGF